MIILSGVLVVVAIALLGAAIVPGIVSGDAETAQVLGVDSLVVIYTSIAVSVVSALCLAIGVFLRRKEVFGTRASTTRKATKQGRSRKAERSAPAAVGKGGAPAQAAAPVGPLKPPSPPPGDSVVHVVRGRKRYHLSTCRQLAGRDSEELTYAAAKKEGYASCTACMPDTALAARAAVSVPAGGTGDASAPEAAKTSELPVAGSGHAPSLDKAPDKPVVDLRVLILSGTKRYHRPGCTLLLEDSGEPVDDVESLPRTEAKSRACTPCLVCRPDHD